MRKKVVIGITAGLAAGALVLGFGFGVVHRDSAQPAPAAVTSRPTTDGEMPAPPAPKQLRPSERVVVNGK